MSIFGIFLVRIFPHDSIQRLNSVFSPIAGKYGLEKLRIWTLFTQWGGCWNIWSQSWYEAEIYVKDPPWWKILINKDFFVFWMCILRMSILQTRNHFPWCQQRLKNYIINEPVLSRGLTGKIFKVMAHLDPQIWFLFFIVNLCLSWKWTVCTSSKVTSKGGF